MRSISSAIISFVIFYIGLCFPKKEIKQHMIRGSILCLSCVILIVSFILMILGLWWKDNSRLEKSLNYDKRKAKNIVDTFFKDMNPTFWNGKGNKPQTFKEQIWEFSLTDNVSLEITLSQDDNEWNHYCDLVYTSSGESFDMLSGYGIDSPLKI